MTTCYIAFHEQRGIYLGMYMGYAMFSNMSIAATSKAIRFASEQEIRDFFTNRVPSIAKEISGLPVTTNSATGNYVDLVDILKSGHTKHTQSMLDNLPVTSYTVHWTKQRKDNDSSSLYSHAGRSSLSQCRESHGTSQPRI